MFNQAPSISKRLISSLVLFGQRLHQIWRWDAPTVVLSVGLLMGVGWIGVSGWGWWRLSQQKLICPAAPLSQEIPIPITVDVGGAVLQPGVYQVSPGSRLAAAVAAAGGLAETADRAVLAKSINLAEPVQDGQKIYIPLYKPDISASQSLALPDSVENSGGKISVNEASLAELDSLPGIGEQRAEEIVAGRPYQRVEELVERKIIGAAVMTDIRELISL